MPAPSTYGNKHFITPVVDLLKNHLPKATEMPDLDGDNSRGLLRFQCGTVLDFRTGTVRPAVPGDRISLCTGYRYQAFHDVDFTVRDALRELNGFWRDGGTELPRIFYKAKLEKLLKHSRLYQVIYQLFEDDDVAMWLLRQSARAVAALPGFEEFIFMTDSRGSNGKGTWTALMKAALGVKNGYYGTLTFEKHFLGTGVAKAGGNDPDLAGCEGKRFVVVNEGPDMEDSKQKLNVSLIKRLTCGSDDPINATAKYKDPSFWQAG